MPTFNSDLYEAQTGRRFKPPAAGPQEPRILPFEYKQKAAGAANDTVNLVKLPAGRVRILAFAQTLYRSAFGAGRSVDIGHLAYEQPDGTKIAADADSLKDGQDVSAAGAFGLTFSGKRWAEYRSVDGVTIQATVLGAGAPAAAELSGFLVVMVLPD